MFKCQSGMIYVISEKEKPIRFRSNRYKIISHGIKIECRDIVYKNLLDMTDLFELLDIEEKRINKFWYSICFKSKNMINIPTVFLENIPQGKWRTKEAEK